MRHFANQRILRYSSLIPNHKWQGIFCTLPTIITLLLFLSTSSFLSAQSPNVWTGNANSDWNNPANWTANVVPNSIGFSAIIPSTATDPVINNSIEIHHVIISDGGRLIVESDGQLNLSAVLPSLLSAILDNHGTVENYGIINISSNVNSNYDNAIDNSGTIENYDELNIQDSNGGGLTNTGTFINRGGTFKIGSSNTVSGNGIIVVDGSVTNQNYLGDIGILEIDRTIDDGIQVTSNGIFTQSSGTLTIGSNVVVGKYGVDNDGAFIGNGGSLNIASSTWSGIKNRGNGEFINNSSTINIGTLTAVGHGINNSGIITNNKTINIQRANNQGLLNTESGEITNTINGVINIGTVTEVGENGINNEGTITNNNKINIQRASLNGLLNSASGVLSNQTGSSFLIGTSDAVGNYGIHNEGSISNNNSTTTIKATDNSGIYIDSGVKFENLAGSVLNIGTSDGSIGGNGLYARFTTIVNDASTVNIENTGTVIPDGGQGIHVDLLSTFDNINGASLNIGQNSGTITKNGIYMTGSSLFINNNSSITIDNSNETGILNLNGFWLSNSNNAVIEVGRNQGNIGGDGIGNATLFDNNNSTVYIDHANLSGIYNFQDGEINNVGGGNFLIGLNGGIDNIGNHGIESLSAFNNTDGSIQIENTKNHGIFVPSTGSFYNNSDLNIGIANSNSIGGDGIHTDNSIINDGGIITVNNATANGIHCDDGAFENNNGGEIFVSDIQQIGIRTKFGGEFINNSTVTVAECGAEGLIISSNGSDYATFVNDNGILHLDGKMSGFLYLGGTLSPGMNGPGTTICTQVAGWLYGTNLEILVDGPASGSEHSMFSTDGNLPVYLEKDGVQSSLSLDISYTPIQDERIVILSAETITGTFGTITPALPNNWMIDYSVPGEVALVYTLPNIRDWIGAVDSDWNKAANWSPALVPTVEDLVNITNEGFEARLQNSDNITIKKLNILNDASFINEGGTLSLDDFDNNALNVNGLLQNEGVINIGQNIGGTGIGMKLNTANVQNLEDGIINIDNTNTNQGIDLTNGSEFDNYGEINIGQYGGPGNIKIDGVEVNSNTSMVNHADGVIRIDNISGNGIYHRGGTFENEGKIEIGLTGGNNNISSRGLRIRASFENKTGGYLEIDNCGSVGISYRDSELINRVCAEIRVHFNSVDGEDGVFINEGLYERANNTYIEGEITTFYRTLNCNLGNMFNIDPDTDLVISEEFFHNPDLTDKAGDYDQVTNRFIPTNIQAGTSILHFTVSSATCSYNVRTYVNSSIDIDHTRTWTGSNDSDWDNRCNWMPGFLPRVTEEVIIPEVTNPPSILDGSDASAKSVIVETGASLHISNGGSLSIQESNDVGLVSNGTVNNYGTLEINDSGTHGIQLLGPGSFTNHSILRLGQNGNTNSIFGIGIWNEANFHNEAGEISIDHTGSLGVYNNGGTFVNKAVINIGENGNIGSEGIQNKSNFYNESGEINIDRSSFGILNSFGIFSNNAPLNIGQNIGISEIGILNSASIENFGEINIDNITEHAIEQLAGDFINQGFLNIGQNNSTGINANGINAVGSFINFNTLNIDHTDGPAIRIFEQNSLFENLGELNIGLNTGALASIGILVESDAEFHNLFTGIIELKDLSSAIKTIHSGSSFTNEGNIYFDNDNNYAIESLSEFHSAGLLGGNGKILLSENELGGTISPGFSPGTFYFENSIQAGDESILVIELEGSTNGTYDFISSIDDMDISNMGLDVAVNYIPEDGDQIIFLEATEIMGTFDYLVNALPEGWELVYNTDNIVLKYSIVLPVDLVSFEAQKKGAEVQLDWTTVAEINNAGFEIWHSDDTDNWRQIGFMEGMGNSTEKNDYQFLHTEPMEGHNYYRLKQIDYDGHFAYSEIEIVRFEKEPGLPRITVYPNPTTDYTYIDLTDVRQPASIWMTNDAGELIHKIEVEESSEKVLIDLQSWVPGTYVFHLQINAQIISKKVIYLGNP